MLALYPRSPFPPMLISRVWFCRSRFPLPASLFPLFLAGCVVDSSKKVSTADTTQHAPVVTVTPVNRGTAGMAQRGFAAFSPNHKAFLVVADPGGAEDEPGAKRFFFW